MLKKILIILTITACSMLFLSQSKAQTTSTTATSFDQINFYFNKYLEFTKTPANKSLLMGMLITPPLVLFLSYPGLPFYCLFWYKRLQHKQPWGIIYDAEIKEPLAFAPIQLYRDNAKIDKQYSDINGKYSFQVKPGDYLIKLDLFGYPKQQFPVAIPEQDSSVALDIPMAQPRNILVKVGIALSKSMRSWVKLLVSLLLTCGIILSASAVRAESTNVNFVLIFLFAVEFIITLLFQNKSIKNRNWGIIYDTQTKAPVKGILVRLWDASLQKLLKVQLTDYTGRYGFKIPPGKYALMVYAPKYIIPATTEFNSGFQKTTTGISYLHLEISHGEGINLSIPAEKVA